MFDEDEVGGLCRKPRGGILLVQNSMNWFLATVFEF